MKRSVFNFFKVCSLAIAVACLASCNTKDETPQGEDNLFFAQFIIDGDTLYYEDGEQNYGNGPGVESYPDLQGRLYSQYTSFIRSALTPNYEDNVITFQMVKLLNDTTWPNYNTEFLMFDEGDYPYGSWSDDSTHLGIDGVVITYTDNDGKVWSSDALFGQQTGSEVFQISSHKAVDEAQFGAKTKGIFRCRVFDGLGGFLDLEYGTFHARTILKPE